MGFEVRDQSQYWRLLLEESSRRGGNCNCKTYWSTSSEVDRRRRSEGIGVTLCWTLGDLFTQIKLILRVITEMSKEHQQPIYAR